MPTALIWCALAASVRYDVPADALLSVYSVERGSTDTWSHDANGTYDVGPLQFNTAYLASLRRFGITPRAVEGKTCYPWFLAAWRIHDQLVEDRGGFWTRVARYHSATPRYVATYRRQLLEYDPRWRAWLIEHYPTVVSAPGFRSSGAPAGDVSREIPSGASHAERSPLATPRRTTAPVGLQALMGEGSPPSHSARRPWPTSRYRALQGRGSRGARANTKENRILPASRSCSVPPDFGGTLECR